MKMKEIVKKLVLKSNKTTIQTLVRNFDIERLGYMFPDIIESEYNVRRGTCSFGISVSEVFSEYKVNKIRLEELNYIIKLSASKAKLLFTPESKKEQIKLHNDSVEEFNELNKPLTKFVKEVNKIYKTKTL